MSSHLTPGHITATAQLSGRSFASFAEATTAVLELLEDQLPASVVWVGHFDCEERVLRVVDARGGTAVGVEAGFQAPLDSSFCHVMASGRGAQMSNDVPRDGAYRDLDAASALSVGSFLGVPLELNSGEAVGTLCAMSTDLDAFEASDLQLLTVIARILAYELEREQREREQRVLADELRRLATTDPLTGLANRRRFLDALQLEAGRVARGGPGACVLVADLDDLKTLNDRHGHAAGDEALRRVSAALTAAAREVDVVGRLGGDEFGVVLVSCTTAADSLCFQERVVLDLGDDLGSAVSFGVGVLAEGREPDGVLAAADAAMYASKNERRRRLGNLQPSRG